jgi:hypothetical protein
VVNPPVAAIRQTGILPRLVYLLKRDDNRALQYEVRVCIAYGGTRSWSLGATASRAWDGWQ